MSLRGDSAAQAEARAWLGEPSVAATIKAATVARFDKQVRRDPSGTAEHQCLELMRATMKTAARIYVSHGRLAAERFLRDRRAHK